MNKKLLASVAILAMLGLASCNKAAEDTTSTDTTASGVEVNVDAPVAPTADTTAPTATVDATAETATTPAQ